jgi:sugar lactone lactonase YvrE
VEGPAAGGDSVVVAAGGAWEATANASWLHTASSGTGSGLATFTFDANPGGTRSGTLTIAGLTLTVTQAGSTYVPANSLTTLVSSGLSFPFGVAVDGAGNLFIADTGNGAIKEWHAATGTVTTLVSGLSGPTGVAVDGVGNVFITDTGNDAVKEWNAATGTVTTLVSSGLSGPTGVAVDGAGDVFIADESNSALKKWHAATGTVSTLFFGLIVPAGVAVDGAGKVFITDIRSNALWEWHAATGGVSNLISSGLNDLFGVAVDAAGNVFIADGGNHAVQEWHAATGTVSTLVSGLNLPRGVAVDAAGNVFIADARNNAIQVLPRAFVPGGALSEGAAAGSDALLPVLPTTQPLTGPFAPSSDQGWLTIDSVADGVVHFSFTANPDAAPRTAHLTVLGRQASVTQAGAAAATYFRVTPSADSVVAGTPVSLTVTAEDAAGNPGAYLGTVHFSSTDPLASLPPDYTFTAADNGVHTFTDVILRTAGSPTVTATDTATGSITGTATVTVDKATPVITWDNAADIPYGTPLGPTQLDATADVPGTFTYTPAAGTVLHAGANQVLSVLFTPTDPSAFSAPSFSKQVTITVDPAPLTVSADATRWYGRPDSTTTVIGHYSGLVNGDTEATIGGPPGFTDSATLGSPPGTYSLTPAGLTTTDYTITYVDGTLTIIPALMSTHITPEVHAVTGKPVTAVITSIDNVDPFGTADSYTATIDWGDGQTTAGKVVNEGTLQPPNYYDILDGGGHTYAAAGSYTVTVTVNHKLGYTTQAVATGTARVTAPLGTGAPPAKPEPAPAAPVPPEQAFVQALYHTLLGRAADAPGLANWTASLQAGATRLQVVQGIWISPEHRGRQVDQLYAAYLHRGADPSGRAFWMNALQGGLSETDVANAFMASDEYLQAHGDLTGYLTGLYADALGRSPSAAELASWQQAAQGGMSRAALAAAFLDSREAAQALVEGFYAKDLGRPADRAGAAAWVEALASQRLSPARVDQMLLASDEFLAHAQNTA